MGGSKIRIAYTAVWYKWGNGGNHHPPSLLSHTTPKFRPQAASFHDHRRSKCDIFAHAIQVHRRSRGTDPYILRLGAR